jgi:predicted protein tyrosine phosphatase
MKLLFICSRNRLRSPTAERVFASYEGMEALSAGTSPVADNPVSADQIEWADIVFVMERLHQRRIQERFGQMLRGKKVVVLGIRDNYKYMDPDLVRTLEEKVPRYLKG